MPAIGVPLCKWTLHLLLLCSTATCAYGQSTNETATVESAPPAASSITKTHITSSSAPVPTLSTRLVSRAYNHTATCPFRTINYITHTLPQQCAKTSWSAPVGVVESNVTIAVAEATPEIPRPDEGGAGNGTIEESRSEERVPTPQAGDSVVADSPSPAQNSATEPDQELETDSPLDNANFLSFEDWKQRNLAQVGQSPENLGQGRPAQNQPARRRPVNVNALDSLGDEGEIELDFSGFGNANEEHSSANMHEARPTHGSSSATEDDKKAAPSSWALSKDAGKTCKERFNYASFDCAATILKTNKQAKSATSVLVENKDSYMLNVCSAENKFFIVELCDDILVDTVVLANYEFFSSMFRHFRISVSDRYPVKMERWRTLATFEARNSRDIQPFLITEPQIWARYLRIEFLTHYGNEFYCPMSLLRVHGTTMMEQFRREEEEARGVDDDVDLETTEDDVVKPAIDSGPIPPAELPIAIQEAERKSEQIATGDVPASTSSSQQQAGSSSSEHTSSTSNRNSVQNKPAEHNTEVSMQANVTPSSKHSSAMSTPAHSDDGSATEAISDSNRTSTVAATSTQNVENLPSGQTTASGPADIPSSAATPQSESNSVVNDTVPRSSPPKVLSSNPAVNVQSASRERPAGTQPSPPVPSTQESFYKSIHKRLTHLEANSTLSLQYIEEQSRILRDAFKKVEQRQLAKTEKFLNHLNSTVMQELRNFRTMYDQLWQSTVIELESMKERQNTEMNEIGTRLTLMADELVWQKRMAVVQSTLLLLCLGLVLFVRSGTLGSTTDVPIVQQLGNKYSSFFEPSPPRSPPESGIARRRRTFRNMWRSDTSAGLSDRDHPSDAHNIISDDDGARSPVNIEYSPPTPDGITPIDQINDPLDDQAQRLEVLETQSGPATPNGTRDSRPSWEEVDRAMGMLKVDQSENIAPPSQQQRSPKERKKDRKKKKKSPLRNSFGDAAGGSGKRDAGDENDIMDSGNELFLSEA